MTGRRAPDLFEADHPYRHVVAGVATRHHKTATLSKALGGPGGMMLRTVDVDTDSLGTFTGDVQRVAGPVETAIAKARLGIDASGHHLALASEGAFGPHAVIGMVTQQIELVVLRDDAVDLTVVGQAGELTSWTRSRVLSTQDSATTDCGLAVELDQLVRDLDPPRHRFIVRPEDPTEHHHDQGIVKGIDRSDDLRSAVRRAAEWSVSGRVRVETDLRAHMSHLRRPLILRAAHDLAQRLSRRCAFCASPGFGRAQTLYGAPCRWCRAPTDSVLAHVDGCPACGHRVRRPADGGDAADPGACWECNP